jgi:vanillate O-demethylase monooxygenase subunit
MIITVPLVLYRHGTEVVAMEDRCAHKAAPLSKGRLEEGGIRCLYHGFKYARDGACVEIPGQNALPKAACVRTFPVVEMNSWIWVWMGDPAQANVAYIPSTVGLEDPHWKMRAGQIDYGAHYELINDNLTDFTHVSYVHAESFGATEEFARTRPHLEPLERGVRIWRWLYPGYRTDSFAETRDGRVTTFESFETYEYSIPGILAMRTVLCPAGTAARFNEGVPDLGAVDIIDDRFSSQAVTPMTARTTRYFYSGGPRATSRDSDSNLDERFERAKQAFIEDKDMIEAQQANIDLDPQRPQVLTSSDIAPMRIRGLIAHLTKQERERSAGADSAKP